MVDHQNPYANIEANEVQIGGSHYKDDALVCPKCGHRMEHWDVSWLWKWDMFQYNVTKYLLRWRNKNGLEDLQKASHHLRKYLEVVAADLKKEKVVTPSVPRGLPEVE